MHSIRFLLGCLVLCACVVRAEGYTELVGDIVLNCTGGAPTLAGQLVPQVNFTVFLNTNVTSKITSAFQFAQNPNSFNANFDEALLFARGMVFGILAQITVGTRFRDRLDDVRTRLGLQLLQLRTQGFGPPEGHRCSFHAGALASL